MHRNTEILLTSANRGATFRTKEASRPIKGVQIGGGGRGDPKEAHFGCCCYEAKSGSRSTFGANARDRNRPAQNRHAPPRGGSISRSLAVVCGLNRKGRVSRLRCAEGV